MAYANLGCDMDSQRGNDKLVSYVFYGIFSTNRLYHAIAVGNVSHMAEGEHKYHVIKQ